MDLFSWLILGHLLGDWLFQSDWMAVGKRQGLVTWAGMLHFTIYTLTILGVLWFFGGARPDGIGWLGAGIIIFASHWLVDATNLVQGWMRLCGQRNQTMVRIMVDQTLHLVILALLAWFLLEFVE